MYGRAYPQQQSQPVPAHQNWSDNAMPGGGWAPSCDATPRQQSQPQQQQHEPRYGGSFSDAPGGSGAPVFNLAKVSRNNESQRTPHRAADVALHHHQHVQHLQERLGAGGSAGDGGARPMLLDDTTEGLSLQGPSSMAELPAPGNLSACLHGGAPLSARTVGTGGQPAAASYQQQARYVVPPPQAYAHSRPAAAVSNTAALAGGSAAPPQQQQAAPASARGFMQRLPQIFSSTAPAPASARALPTTARPPVNPYLQAMPSATARPHYNPAGQAQQPGTGSFNLPPLHLGPASARGHGNGNGAPPTSRVPPLDRAAHARTLPNSSGQAAPVSARGDVYARLSQGLPSIETARSARLQTARGVPPPQQEQPQPQRQAYGEPLQAVPPHMQGQGAGAPSSARGRLPPAAQQQQRQVAAHSANSLPPVDSPGSSTGLTPRAAGLMRNTAQPSLAGPQVHQHQHQQQGVDGGRTAHAGSQSVPGDEGHLFASTNGAAMQQAPALQQAWAPAPLLAQPQDQHAWALAPPPAQPQQHVWLQQQQYQQHKHQQQQYQQQIYASGPPPPVQQLPSPNSADHLAKLHSFQSAVGGDVLKPAGLLDSGPLESEAIKAVRRQSQPPLGPLQQGLPSSAAQSYLQPQPLAHDPYSGAALQAAAAHLPPASWGQQPARSSFDGKAAAQRLSQPAAPLLPGLPFVEHAAAEGQAAVLQPPVQAPPPQRMRAAPPHAPPAQQQVQYQLQQEYQQHQQRPNIFAPAPGSDLDLVAAVAEEVAEYDLLRQEELEVQEKAAAVAAAAQRVSALAERSSGGPLPTVRAGSSASSRLPSPKPMSLAASEQRPMSAARALQQWGHLLTPFEQSEILSFAAVWFVGKPGAPKIRGDKCGAETHHGYDDTRGDYLTVVGDHIAYRFEVTGVLGRGSFGQVLRCVDHRSGTEVALKMIRSKRRFQKQAAIEAAILDLLRKEDPDDSVNIVRTYESFTFRGHLCITFELLGINLYEQIKAGNFQGSSIHVVRRVAQQVLVTLRFLLRLKIVHCDLKPENILLRERGKMAVKVIDFGSSCYVNQRLYTYIQSRFYRSPEVILGLPYGPPIDMWSMGCILAELCTGQPIFPGEDEREQLACIMELLGAPPRALVQAAPRANLFFDTNTWSPLPCPPNSRGKTHRLSSRTLERALGGCDDAPFLDFLRRCLQWEPESRMTPDEALQHPWIAGSILGASALQGFSNAALPAGSSRSSAAGTWRPSAGGGGSSVESGVGGGLAALASGLLSGTARVAAGFL